MRAGGLGLGVGRARGRIRRLITNMIRNSDFNGGTAGTFGSGAVMPNNMALNDDGSTLPARSFTKGVDTDGIPYIDLTVNGTYGAPGATLSLYVDFDTLRTIAPATLGETWTIAVETQLTAGAVTNATFRIAMTERTAVAQLVSAVGTNQAPTGAMATHSNTRTLSNASVAYASFVYEIICAGAVNFTVRFKMPRLTKTATAPLVTETARTSA